jgi:hypothetical protein
MIHLTYMLYHESAIQVYDEIQGEGDDGRE